MGYSESPAEQHPAEYKTSMTVRDYVRGKQPEQSDKIRSRLLDDRHGIVEIKIGDSWWGVNSMSWIDGAELLFLNRDDKIKHCIVVGLVKDTLDRKTSKLIGDLIRSIGHWEETLKWQDKV